MCSYDSETSECIVSFKGQESKPAETFQAMTDAEIREGVEQRFSEVGDGTRKEMWQCLRSMMARDYCRYDSKTESYVLYKWIKTKGTWKISEKTPLKAKDTSDEQLKKAIAKQVSRKGDLHSVVFDELQRLKTEDEKLKNRVASRMLAEMLSV